VALLAWPADADHRDRLAALGRPRLLVVDPTAAPPSSADLLEDWVRSPADPEELAFRRATLAERARRRARPAVLPVLDADDILRLGDEWLALPPLEARIVGRLLATPGAVVRRADLVAAAWPDGPPTDPRALDVRVKVLRKRLAAFGLRIHTVAQRGHLLEVPR
jgi:DNA-binding response OmpR family regulator